MLKDTLTYFSNKLHSFLFPIVEDKLYDDVLLKKHYQIISILEVIQIEKFIPQNCRYSRGKPVKHRLQVARALIAKHVLNLKTTSELIHHLKVDKNLRYICGWEPGQRLADESTFSRVFKLIAETGILEEIHSKLTEEVFENRVVLHNGRDSVPIPAREWPEGKKENRKKARSKQQPKSPYKKVTVCEEQAQSNDSADEMLAKLPTRCSIGRKTNSSGKTTCWRGYKLHMDVAEGWFPISCAITSAHTHDTQTAIPLSIKSSERCQICYELMDSAYDSKSIYEFIEKNGRRALIVPRIWNGKRGEETERELRAQKTLGWKPAEGIRLQQRFACERLFSRVKDHFSGMSVWVRGYTKVKCHVMLSVLCLAVDELLRMSG